ncbi:GntR family transcriptional regulator [Streptomyces sp. NPDC008139]|uniref:GntR family transcriptional regulator n=1 Tax=Streptomyces sp. NPDC008139 TaxID=3364814 RepID=UPI0036E518A3
MHCARGIDHGSVVPFYHRLKQLIIEDIAARGLEPGDRLSGDFQLCERYGVSRTVVRQALQGLEREGAVIREKGRGTFVADRKSSEGFGHAMIGLFEEDARRPNAVNDDDVLVPLRHTNGVRTRLWMSSLAAQDRPRFLLRGARGSHRTFGLDLQEVQLRPGDADVGVKPAEPRGEIAAGAAPPPGPHPPRLVRDLLLRAGNSPAHRHPTARRPARERRRTPRHRGGPARGIRRRGTGPRRRPAAGQASVTTSSAAVPLGASRTRSVPSGSGVTGSPFSPR